MTGFGLGDAPLGSGRIVLEARAVNSRFLDARVRLPRALADMASFVESDVRKRLSRGRLEIAVRTEGAIFSSPAIDKERARAAYGSLIALRDDLAPGREVPLSMLTALPDLFVPQIDHDFEAIRAALRAALAAALDAMDAMRRTEGYALGEELTQRSEKVRCLIEAVDARGPDVVEAHRARLAQRLARLLDPSGRDGTAERDARSSPPGPLPDAREGREREVSIGATQLLDPTRLEQEVCLFADRSDIAEEITRLKSHLEQFVTFLSSDEPTGRRLDFLLQEMAREINTIGSKSQDVATSHMVVDLKVELERMREQVQNVE